MTKLNNVSNMEKVYRIYFENEEIGTVKNLDGTQEIIKNDILERGFDSSDIETYQDDYFITEEVKYNSDNAINYINEYLLNCETNQQDILINVKGEMEVIDVVDVIGVTEEKGRIYIGLEVEYNEYCYLINISFIDVWEYVYKDEMIEIQDTIIKLISEQLKIDLDI